MPQRLSMIVALLGIAASLCMCASDDAPKTLASSCLLNTDCNNPLSCTFGRCHETCEDTRDCPSPQRCVHAPIGNVCQLEDETSCLYASQCQPPLRCAVDSRCRNACLNEIDCLVGQRCVDGSCADLDEVAANGHLKNAKDADALWDGEAPKGDGLPTDETSLRNDGSQGSDVVANAADGNMVDASVGSADATPADVTATDVIPTDSAGGDAVRTDADGGRPSTAPWHLWVLERNTQHIYGYAPIQLRTTNGDEPEIVLTLSDPLNSFHFDAQGNLWGAMSSQTGVVKYDAAGFAATGAIMPTGRFTENALGNVTDVTFDGSGNLWTSGYNNHGEYRYDVATLATVTATLVSLAPTFKSAYGSAGAIAFDGTGHFYGLFNAASGSAVLGRYNASQLVGTGSISEGPAMTMNPELPFGGELFITPAGQLVVPADQVLYRYSAAQIAQTGLNVRTMPEATISLSGVSGFSARRVTLDPDGNLWAASGEQDRVYKLAAADLAQTGTVAIVPSMTLRAPVSNSNSRFGSVAVH